MRYEKDTSYNSKAELTRCSEFLCVCIHDDEMQAVVVIPPRVVFVSNKAGRLLQ
jgi:hypothetical protein